MNQPVDLNQFFGTSAPDCESHGSRRYSSLKSIYEHLKESYTYDSTGASLVAATEKEVSC